MSAASRKAETDVRTLQVFAMLNDAAEKGIQAPGNSEISRRLGYASTTFASGCIGKLIDRGLIEVTNSCNKRQVTIVQTGKVTAPIVRAKIIRHILRDEPESFARVERDPCTYCGVRGDIGCRHNRRAA